MRNVIYAQKDTFNQQSKLFKLVKWKSKQQKD